VTSIRLAYGGPPEALAKGLTGTPEPSLLVSYVYLDMFLKQRHRYNFRDWVMDSGAFSAFNSGTEIKLQDYIDVCKKLKATDPKLTHVFSLDVIGDWRGTLKNTEEMWRQGVEAIPTFHFGTPEKELYSLARDYPRIALGGISGKHGKEWYRFVGQCFARVWPKWIHGFGVGGEKEVFFVPWSSVDATNWELGPCKFGRWKTFGGLSVRGGKHNLRVEVEWWLDFERRAQYRWRREMETVRKLK